MGVCILKVNSILSRMLESLNLKKTRPESQEALLNSLEEKLTGRRYVLVLDDAWNENDILWSSLISCLLKLNSARGSS